MENSFLREPLDVTIESQKFLSCVARFQQRKESFGSNYTVKVLCGSSHLEEGHNELSTYGIGRDKGGKFWGTLFNFLLTNNFVEADNYKMKLFFAAVNLNINLRGCKTALSL